MADKKRRTATERTQIGIFTVTLLDDGSLRVNAPAPYELFAGRAFPGKAQGGSIEIRPVTFQ